MRLCTWTLPALSAAILVLPLAAAAPAINPGGVVNAADYTANLSPGMIISIFGSSLAPKTSSATSVPLPTTLEGVTVEIQDFMQVVKAPLFFVSPGQINAQLPFSFATPTPTLRVRTAEGLSNGVNISILSQAPRLFTRTLDGEGEAILVHADYKLVTADNPAAAGETLVLYLTGLGEVSPSISAGQAGGDGSAGKPLNLVKATVSVKVDGQPAAVTFAGLAPYFVGLYQVNFQVPPDTASGSPTITVSAGQQESQLRVSFVCASGSPPVASASIGPAGGAVSGGGFQLTIPSGAFPAASQVTVSRGAPGASALSARYRLVGLPASVSADLTVSLELTTTPPAGSTVFVRWRQVEGDETSLFLDAQLQSGRVVATLPATDSLLRSESWKPGEARQAAPAQSLRTDLTVNSELEVLGLRPTQASKQFPMFYERISGDMANQISQILDAAADKLVQLGFDLKKYPKWPITVYVFEFDKPDDPKKHDVYAYSVYKKNTGTAYLEINARKAQTAADIPVLAGTVIHELLHILQTGYYPAGARKDDPVWLWMDEAAAVWVSRRMGSDPASVPMEVKGSEAFFTYYTLQRTLNESAASMEAERIEVETHGYGAAQFLEVLARNHPLQEKVIPALFDYRTAHRGDTPVYALQMLVDDLGADWLRFCGDWIDGKIYGQNWPDYETVRSGIWHAFSVPENDQLDTTDSWDAPPLMAKIWGLRTDHHLHLGTSMKVSLDEPTGQSEMMVYAVDDTKSRPTLYKLYRGRGPYQLPDISKLITRQTMDQNGSYYVFVMVPNLLGLQGKPTTPIKLRMELTPPAAPPPPQVPAWLKDLGGVLLQVSVPWVCTATGVSNPSCASRVDLSNPPLYQNQKAMPLVWQGLSFSLDATYGSAPDTTRVEISGTLSSDLKVLDSLRFKRTHTWKDNFGRNASEYFDITVKQLSPNPVTNPPASLDYYLNETQLAEFRDSHTKYLPAAEYKYSLTNSPDVTGHPDWSKKWDETAGIWVKLSKLP